MARPTRTTYLRRRAVAALAIVALLVAVVAALSRGGGEDAPADRASEPRVAPAAARAPADPATIAARADVPVLCYHQIRALTAGDSARDRTYIVPPERLDAQLAALQRAGYASVSADDVAAHMADGRRLPPKPVLLSFDDASAGQYTRALPALRRHGFRATFFVMTVVLDKPGWLTRKQVRALDRDGMQIGLHTWDHSAVPDYTADDWTTQLTEPKAELEGIVGHPLDAFAYPFGLWSPAAFAPLQEAGVRIAFQLGDTLDRGNPMYTARRILVGPDTDGAELLDAIRQDF